MKVQEIRLFKEPSRSFILYHEKNPFSPWHYHPEYELVYIKQGKGKRMVGDHIDRFEDNDLVFMGSNVPHEWLCDDEYFVNEKQFLGEGIVIQFLYDFIGKDFFDTTENRLLKKVLLNASRGIELNGESKQRIISYMESMLEMTDTEQLYALFSIFNVLSNISDPKLLASIAFVETFQANSSTPMGKAIQFIFQNFQKQIYIADLLEITNMSYTAFYNTFRQTYRMPFKTYLLNIRIGYACRLLLDATKSISEIAFESGFENISNFNRQFKKIKGVTPSLFQHQNIKGNISRVDQILM